MNFKRDHTMRLHTFAAGIGMAVALAGCASSGGLHPEGTLTDAASLKTSQSLTRLDVSPADWPSQDWWTSLGDPQLTTLINEALKHNPSLAETDARSREAQAQVGIADADRQPTVSASGAYSGARIPTTLLPSDAGGGHYKPAKYVYASFSWDLDLWGGKRAAWEAALGQARAAQIAAQAARIELSANVARAYVQLGYAYDQVRVAGDDFKRASDFRKLTNQRVNAGIDSKFQLKQGDSEVATAQREQAVAQRAVESAQSALSVLLGKGPDRGLAIIPPTPLQPTAVAVPDNVSVDLIGHRADLVAARWRVEAAAKNIKVAKTRFLPDVSISALAGLITTGGGNLFQLPARFYQAGPTLSLPIFEGGRLRANLSGRDAQYDEAVAQYNQTLVRAVNQVADDLAGLRSLGQQIAAQQRALDAASQAYELSDQRYQAGIGSYLESLTVRQQLLGAQQAMAALQSQQVDLSVQLLQALGGGYQPNSGNEPPGSTAKSAQGAGTPASSSTSSSS